MLNRIVVTGAVSALALGAAAAQTPAPAPAPAKLGAAKTMMSTKEVMKYITNPAAETFWKASGEVDTEEAETSRAPQTDERWAEAVAAAAVVQESANLLMMDGRARDEPWMRFAQQMADAGAAGMKAALAKNAEATFETGGEMYNACFNCHGRYIPRPANSLWKQP